MALFRGNRPGMAIVAGSSINLLDTTFQQFTGFPGVYVKLEDSIRGFKELCDGVHDELPEQAFYMVGTIDEALEKAKKLAA